MLVALVIAATAIPIIVAVVRALVDGWIPLGDQALLEIRAHDVAAATIGILFAARRSGSAGAALAAAAALAAGAALAAAAFAGLGWAEPRILSSLTRFATLRQAAEMSTVAVLLLPSDYRLGPF